MSAAELSFLDLLSDDIISVIVTHTSTRLFLNDWNEEYPVTTFGAIDSAVNVSHALRFFRVGT